MEMEDLEKIGTWNYIRLSVKKIWEYDEYVERATYMPCFICNVRDLTTVTIA